jgi:hypothetical protein
MGDGKLFKFENLDKVRDKLSGFAGTIDCRTDWSNGCVRYAVVALELKDGKPLCETFDEEHLELIEASAEDKPERTGGGRPAAERAADPGR